MTNRTATLRRRMRRSFPRMRPRDCCYHHAVDWRLVAGIAVRLVRQAHAEGVTGESIGAYVTDHAIAEGIDDQNYYALILLVGPGDGIELKNNPGVRPGDQYHDGQHRVAAHIDQRVPETVVQRHEVVEIGSEKPGPF